jgi:hypothetical protein
MKIDTKRGGWLMIEMVVALGLLITAVLPLAFSLASEKRLLRSSYQHAVAMEIVDGEMEALAAGGWQSFGPGKHDYEVRAGAISNLPPGKFVLNITGKRVRLEWRPALKDSGGAVFREWEAK